MRLGYVLTERRAEAQTGLSQLPEIDTRDTGLAVSAFYDSRNTGGFATKGVAAAIEYLYADDALGGDRDWERIEAGVRTAIPVGKHFMWFSLACGADLGDELPADRAFSLGGPRRSRLTSSMRCGLAAMRSPMSVSSGASRSWWRSRTRRSTAASVYRPLVFTTA
jgi:outer membrane protein assembly factor BamA